MLIVFAMTSLRRVWVIGIRQMLYIRFVAYVIDTFHAIPRGRLILRPPGFYCELPSLIPAPIGLMSDDLSKAEKWKKPLISQRRKEVPTAKIQTIDRHNFHSVRTWPSASCMRAVSTSSE